MDLNQFINPNQKKQTYKVSFKIGNEKITKFISAYSEQGAKSTAEQELKKERQNSKIVFVEIKELTKNKEV
ncbi:MAG: hypothetical protein Q8R04_00885 [Nanoarchaeota archaeon]|nr:hypothetical protein [Nanoarchaeota archaeon]